MSDVKIAQISDLHCADSSSNWEEYFKNYVIEFLGQEKPDIILITGDCVDSPTEENFKKLKKSFKTLHEKLEEAVVISVPGNHDYWIMGTRKPPGAFFKWGLEKIVEGFTNWEIKFPEEEVKSPKRIKLYEKYEPHLLWPQKKSKDELIEKCFKEFNIALFPIDSNSTKNDSWLAQGHVQEPSLCFDKWEKKFKKIAEEKSINYSPRIKIAFLHHHLLPLKSDFDAQKNEPFMLLQNSHQVLKEALKYQINLVLHGHRHISGISRYSTLPSQQVPLIVSSCGSTSCPKAEKREIKIYEISAVGECKVESSYSRSSDEPFEKADKSSISIVDYELIRDRKFFSHPWDENETSLKKVKGFRKYVDIFEDGSGDITLHYDDIEWFDKNPAEDKKVIRQINASVGRVCEFKYNFSPSESFDRPNHPVTFESCGESNEKEIVKVEKFQLLDQGEIKNSKYCKVHLSVDNIYTFNKREFRETYKIGGDIPEEASHFEVGHQVEYFNLIVTFPRGKDKKKFGVDSPFFPDIKQIYVDVECKNFQDDENEGDGTIICQKEKGYLNKNFAVEKLPEFNQISLFIRKPQPDLKYILKWGLKDEMVERELTFGERKKFLNFQAEFHDTSSDKVGNFFQYIVWDLKDVIGDDLGIFLWGYDSEDKYLQIIYRTQTFKEIGADNINKKSNSVKLPIGRGVAGKAFRTREVQRWRKPGNKLEDDFHHRTNLEVIPGYDPEAVIAIPLNSTLIFPTLEDNQNNVETLCFGVISLFSNNYDALETYFECSNEKFREEANLAFNSVFHPYLDETGLLV